MTTLAPAPGDTEVAPIRSLRRSALLLTVVLFVAVQFTDPAGYLSTDVGGKTATLEILANDGLRHPDIGYWAEQWDPDGSLHPISHTSHIEGRWVNVTTFPMLYLALPLHAVGGMRLAMLVPVLGTVLAALAAAALARRLGGDQAQARLAFWLIGIGSPATVYALDFWEHSLGLALMGWGTVAVLDAAKRAPVRWWLPAAAGVAFAAAASMRQEALVYGAVAGLALTVSLVAGGHVVRAVTRGAVMAGATIVGLAANSALEWVVIGSTQRNQRSTGTVGNAGDDTWFRLREALESGVSPVTGDTPLTYVLAFTLTALLVLLARRADLPADRVRPLWFGLIAVTLFVALDFVIDGPRFLPGMLATTPIAALGVVRGWRPGPARMLTVIGAGSLPLVWYVQYVGGVSAQWGGRYILTSGLLLTVVGIVSCTSENARRTVRVLAAAGIVIAGVGVGWTVYRTHSFGDVTSALADRPEPVVLFDNSSLAREAGPRFLDQRWLGVNGDERRAEAVVLLAAAGIDEVAFVEYDDGRLDRVLPGWEMVDEQRLHMVNDLYLRVTTWVDPPG